MFYKENISKECNNNKNKWQKICSSVYLAADVNIKLLQKKIQKENA